MTGALIHFWPHTCVLKIVGCIHSTQNEWGRPWLWNRIKREHGYDVVGEKQRSQMFGKHNRLGCTKRNDVKHVENLVLFYVRDKLEPSSWKDGSWQVHSYVIGVPALGSGEDLIWKEHGSVMERSFIKENTLENGSIGMGKVQQYSLAEKASPNCKTSETSPKKSWAFGVSQTIKLVPFISISLALMYFEYLPLDSIQVYLLTMSSS